MQFSHCRAAAVLHLTHHQEKRGTKTMKYGKRLRDDIERSLPKWRGEFISYKQLKKQLYLFDIDSRAKKRSRFSFEDLYLQAGNGSDDVNSMRFTQLLDEELHKVNEFYIDKEEDYVIELKELKNREANLCCSTMLLNLQRSVLDFHAEMVRLLHYTVLNSTGFRKIVKKHKKRAGSSNVEFYSMPRVEDQPFFSTDLLYNLMEECQAMLHRLNIVFKNMIQNQDSSALSHEMDDINISDLKLVYHIREALTSVQSGDTDNYNQLVAVMHLSGRLDLDNSSQYHRSSVCRQGCSWEWKNISDCVYLGL